MRHFVSFMLLAFTMMGARAQTTEVELMEVPASRYSVKTNSFWDNWFVTVGGGAQVIYGTPSGDASFGDRMSPSMQLAVGKWFTPGLGLRTQVNGIWCKQVKGDDCHNFQYMNLHEDVMFNLSNMLAGYTPSRLYNLILYAGGGVYHDFDLDHGWGLGFNGGIINRLNVSSAFSVELELYTTLLDKKFDVLEGNRRGLDQLIGAALSVTYHFPKSGFENVPNVDDILALSAAQNAETNQMLADCQSENEALRQQLRQANQNKTQPVISTPTTALVGMPPQSVFFCINSSVLQSKKEVVNLQALADYAKRTQMRLLVTGYADSSTGLPEYNQTLSQARANTVVNELVRLGVPRTLIEIKADGGVNTLEPPYLNRRAVVTVMP